VLLQPAGTALRTPLHQKNRFINVEVFCPA